jgi:ribonuclease HI
MLGAIRAIEVYGTKADRLQIYTDYKPLVDGATVLLPEWIKSNRIETLVNKDLWLQLHSHMNRFMIEWFWVRGHYTDVWNNRADVLAKEALLELTW